MLNQNFRTRRLRAVFCTKIARNNPAKYGPGLIKYAIYAVSSIIAEFILQLSEPREFLLLKATVYYYSVYILLRLLKKLLGHTVS